MTAPTRKQLREFCCQAQPPGAASRGCFQALPPSTASGRCPQAWPPVAASRRCLQGLLPGAATRRGLKAVLQGAASRGCLQAPPPGTASRRGCMTTPKLHGGPQLTGCTATPKLLQGAHLQLKSQKQCKIEGAMQQKNAVWRKHRVTPNLTCVVCKPDASALRASRGRASIKLKMQMFGTTQIGTGTRCRQT